MKASVNLKFSSFAPRHRLSKLISALGLASFALTETLVSQKRLACEFRGGSPFLLQSYHFETPSLSATASYGRLQKQTFLEMQIFLLSADNKRVYA